MKKELIIKYFTLKEQHNHKKVNLSKHHILYDFRTCLKISCLFQRITRGGPLSSQSGLTFSLFIPSRDFLL